MHRPKRFEVDKIKVPVAESNRAGVIIDVSTASPADSVKNSGLFKNGGS